MDLGPISTNPLPYNYLSFPITQTYIFFKWGALVLALVASFTTLIKGVKVLILNKSIQYSLQKGHVVSDNLDYESESDDTEEEESSGSYSSVSDDTEENDRGMDFGLRRRCNGSVLDLAVLFTTGKNVVKLWDSVADNVVVSADRNPSGRFLKVWDTRVNSAWAPRVSRVKVKGSGGVVLRDDVTGGMAAGDVRKMGSPMVGLTVADVDSWWDANGAVSSVSWSED